MIVVETMVARVGLIMVVLVMVAAAVVLIMVDGCRVGGSHGGGSSSNGGMAVLGFVVGAYPTYATTTLSLEFTLVHTYHEFRRQQKAWLSTELCNTALPCDTAD